MRCTIIHVIIYDVRRQLWLYNIRTVASTRACPDTASHNLTRYVNRQIQILFESSQPPQHIDMGWRGCIYIGRGRRTRRPPAGRHQCWEVMDWRYWFTPDKYIVVTYKQTVSIIIIIINNNMTKPEMIWMPFEALRRTTPKAEGRK